MPQEEAKTEPALTSRKTRHKVVVVGQTRLRLLQQDAYQQRVARTIKINSWKREQFANKEVCCAICGWKPPVFLTKAHIRTFLTIHHMIPSADGGSDDPDNLIILCPNCHSLADYLPSIIVMPSGAERRDALISHLRLLNEDPESWKRL